MNNHSYYRNSYALQETVNATQPFNSYYTYNNIPVNSHHNEENYGIHVQLNQIHRGDEMLLQE